MMDDNKSQGIRKTRVSGCNDTIDRGRDSLVHASLKFVASRVCGRGIACLPCPFDRNNYSIIITAAIKAEEITKVTNFLCENEILNNIR